MPLGSPRDREGGVEKGGKSRRMVIGEHEKKNQRKVKTGAKVRLIEVTTNPPPPPSKYSKTSHGMK